MPGFVILATSIANEGIVNDPDRIRQEYLSNTRRLIRMVEAIEAVPILITPYPNSAFSPSVSAVISDVTRHLESEGVMILDFWSATDDGAGRWLPGLSPDGTHPNDTGHLALFESIPLGFFDFALNPHRPLPPRQGFGSWVAGLADRNQPAISVSPASPAPSWSAAFWTSAAGEGEQKTLLEVAGTGARVRRSGQRFELLLNDEIVAAGFASAQGGFQHVGLTHKKLTGVLTLYVNGEAVGSASAVGAEPARLFTLGTTSEQPGIQGDSVAQFLIYRTPLSAEDMRELAAGRVPTKSLEAHLPLSQSPARRNQNAAPTIVDVVIGGAWHWVAEGPRTVAVP